MLELLGFLTLLLVGYLSGSWVEHRHFASIRRREMRLRQVRLIGIKRVPPEYSAWQPQLVAGSVVVSVDYFKRIAAGLRNFFGGRVAAYETLIERARREAMLRMRQQAADCGAALVFNPRLETAAISSGAGGQIGAVEVHVCGTALRAPPAGTAPG